MVYNNLKNLYQIILSYNMLDNTTKMFNFVQNKLRDTVRRNTNKIVFRESDINESIKNLSFRVNVCFSNNETSSL